MAAHRPLHQIFESPRAELRLAWTVELLRALPEESPVLIVADNQAAAQWLVAEARRGLPGACFAWHRRTLQSLAQELTLPALAKAQRVALRGLGPLALCTRVVESQMQRGSLGRYRGIAQRPGFARALVRTLGELRASGVSAAQLAEHDADLAELYAAYERALDALGLADPALILELATQAAAAGSRFAGMPLVLLDVELATLREGELVSALCQRASQVCATVVRGDERSEAYLWQALPSASVRRLEPQDARDLSRLQARLFAAAAPPLETPSERGGVRILSCPGESREAVEVVRSVLAAAARGVPFDAMAIALRAGEVYRAVVEEALVRAGIPAHHADGVRRPLPEGRALLLLIECAREALSARAFAEYLSLGLLPAAEPDAHARRGRWERLLKEAAASGNAQRWRARLALHDQTLSDRMQRADPEGRELAKLQGDRLALGELRAFLEGLLPLLEELPRGHTWGSYLSALTRLAELSLAAPAPVTEVLEELLPLSDVADVSLSDVQRVLASRLTSLVVPSQGHGAGKLLVGTPGDLRGRSFAVVFTLGLAEQLFPPRLAEDPLLPDRTRRLLSPELSVLEERAAHERLMLRVCVGAAQQELVLSYPRFDLEHGRPRVPSFYGLEVLHAMDGTLPAFDELARRAQEGAAARMGFPAPAQPEDAVDDAEFDLALLGELMRMAPAQRAGGLRYLLAQHVHLARALRFRARRWTLSRFSPADGFVAADEATRALLAPYQLSARAYAPSALAQMAACPYRFYLQAICGLRERAESFGLAELTARERGVLMHAVQRGTLSELRDQGLLPLTHAALETALAVLERQFDQHAQREKERREPALARVLDETLTGLREDLREWLRSLVTRAEGWVPSYFELAFGVESSAELDPHSVAQPVALPGLKLKGVIDLVEQHAARDEHGRVRLRVTDHKSSLPDEQLKRDLRTGGGKLLQPLLYGLALEQLFPGAHVGQGRLYYCTTRADFQEQEVPLDGTARAAFTELVTAIDSLLLAGFLPAAPAKDECGRCAYLAVCGPYEEKERVPVVKAKDMTRLSPLFRLRNLP